MTTAGTSPVAIEALPFRLHAGASPFAESDDARRDFYVVPAQPLWQGAWELAADLLIEASAPGGEVAVVTHLTVQEYGAGPSLGDAVADLLDSLREYRESLEAREERLAPPAQADLAALRTLLRRAA